MARQSHFERGSGQQNSCGKKSCEMRKLLHVLSDNAIDSTQWVFL
jgi:hypothetical protein